MRKSQWCRWIQWSWYNQVIQGYSRVNSRCSSIIACKLTKSLEQFVWRLSHVWYSNRPAAHISSGGTNIISISNTGVLTSVHPFQLAGVTTQLADYGDCLNRKGPQQTLNITCRRNTAPHLGFERSTLRFTLLISVSTPVATSCVSFKDFFWIDSKLRTFPATEQIKSWGPFDHGLIGFSFT